MSHFITRKLMQTKIWCFLRVMHAVAPSLTERLEMLSPPSTRMPATCRCTKIQKTDDELKTLQTMKQLKNIYTTVNFGHSRSVIHPWKCQVHFSFTLWDGCYPADNDTSDSWKARTATTLVKGLILRMSRQFTLATVYCYTRYHSNDLLPQW